MSKKTQTTSNSSASTQNVYDPASMQAYHAGLRTAMPAMQKMVANPFNNPFFNLSLGQGMANANRMGAGAMQSLGTSMRQRGINDNSPMAAALQAYQGRVNSGMQSNAFLGAANQAQSNYWNALQGLASMRPLQTGGNSQGSSNTTQTVSGTGSWLPQVAGAALGAVGGMATGGMLGTGGFANAMGNMFGGGAPMGGGESPAFGALSNMPTAISGMYGGGYGAVPTEESNNVSNFIMNPWH